MDPLEAARALLPAWVVWGPLYTFPPVVFVWAFVLTLMGAAIGGRPPTAKADDGPHAWIERTRRVYPARMGTALLALFLPIMAALIALLFAGNLLPIGTSGVSLGAFFAAWFGAAVARYRVERRILPSLTPRLFVAGTLVRWLFFVWPLMLIGIANLACGDTFDRRSVLSLSVVGACFAALSLGGGIHIGRLLGLVKRAGPPLEAIVARVGSAVGHTANSVWVAKTGMANAWVLFVGRELVWTSRALEFLTDDEIAAVTAHELGHLSESKAVTRARILRLLLFFPLCALRPVAGDFGALSAALLVIAFLVSMIAVGRVARRMEQRADDVAHDHEGDAGTYARALESIYRANQTPAVLFGKGGVHGHLYDRLVSTGTTPSYARPQPPSRARSSAAALIPLLAGVCGLLLLRMAMVAHVSVEDDRQVTYVVAALAGADHQMLELLADEADARGAFEEADVFFRAADFVLPTQPAPPPPDPFGISE